MLGGGPLGKNIGNYTHYSESSESLEGDHSRDRVRHELARLVMGTIFLVFRIMWFGHNNCSAYHLSYKNNKFHERVQFYLS